MAGISLTRTEATDVSTTLGEFGRATSPTNSCAAQPVTPPSLRLPWRSCTNCSRLRTDGNYVVAIRRWRNRIVRRHGLVGRRIRGGWSRHGCECPEAICCPSAQPKGPDVSSAWIRASSSKHSRRQGQLAGCYSRHRTADSHTPNHSTPLTSLSRRFTVCNAHWPRPC